MSKVLLIKPRFFSLDFQAITHPVGLMYIGATLKMAGHEPKIHDCALDHKNLQILRRTIKDWNPDFIGISIINTELQLTKKIMGIIRDLLPIVPVIFGGPWPTANPKEAIKKYGADFVVIGEGESVFPQLIDVINKGQSAEFIPGTASMVKGNTIKINPGYYFNDKELDALPFPAWDLLDLKLYAKTSSFTGVGFRPYMSIITSRGCPFKCTYCHQTMGKAFRKRSAESVLDEMEELRFKYGIKEFEILDDCFNYDRQRMSAILAGIKNRIGDAILHFPNALRSDLLEPEDMLMFKQAGTVSACFSIETYTPRLQKLIHRNLDIEKATRIINASVKAGIYSTGYFMLGFPTESYEEASATVEFAVRSPLHNATFMFVSLLEGSKLASVCADILKKRDEFINLKNINYFTHTLNISAMSDRDLQKVFRRAYLRFYLNPKRLARLIIHHPRLLSLPHYAFLFLMRILPGRTSTA